MADDAKIYDSRRRFPWAALLLTVEDNRQRIKANFYDQRFCEHSRLEELQTFSRLLEIFSLHLGFIRQKVQHASTDPQF